jgi:NCS1 family nucleobase:cation symporter-1
MAQMQAEYGQVTYPDGRVEIQDIDSLESSKLANHDLDPVPVKQRTWGTYNYTALWVGMAHSIPSWTLASGLIAVGMSWKQAVFTIVVANLIVLVPILLNGHAGTKYGIPFPVFARASFGVRGANLPAILRALVASVWVGVNSWIGGEGIYILGGKLIGHWWVHASAVSGFPWTEWLSFLVFVVLQIGIIIHGIEAVKRFEVWAAPIVIAAVLALFVYVTVKAGGFGGLLSQPGTLHGSSFWVVFFPSLMGMIGFWSTLSLNISDFTRFGGSQRSQMLGQTFGLPTTMTLFALLSVLVTSASRGIWGKTIWDPVVLVSHINSPIGTLLALFTVLVASLSINVAANLVSPAYDFSNAMPKHINFRRGAIIAVVLGVLIHPWLLVSNPHIYIDTWLDSCAGMLGPIAGVLIADYWLVHRKFLVTRDLYSTRSAGRYWFANGWNWRGVVSFLVGAILAVGGSYSTVTNGVRNGPFPVHGLIPFLQPLADYGWLVGIVAAIILQYGLSTLFPVKSRGEATADSERMEEIEQLAPESLV